VVNLLLEAYSHAALIPDSLGRLPLHYALSNGADPSIVNALLRRAPDACRGVDGKGWTPLHVACSVGAGLPVIQALVEMYPEAVVFRTSKGSSPAALLPPNCSDRAEIKDMLKQARVNFDRVFINPLLTEAKSAEDLMIV
jgi:ankyrin repeat protein